MANLPYDGPSSDIGKLRALIPDISPIQNLMTDGSLEFIFGDDELNAYLALNGGNIRRALADALEVLGTNEMMVGKVITTQDLVTDTSKLMAQYLARAKAQRALADTEVGPLVDQSSFEVIPGDCYPPAPGEFYNYTYTHFPELAP